MRIITPPPDLPVTVEQFRAAVHIDSSEDDAALAALLAAAVDVVETGARRPMLARVVEFDLPPGDWSRWWVPVAPVIDLIDAPEGFDLIQRFGEPQVLRRGGAAEVLRATVGYEAGTHAPPALEQAVILIAKEWLDAGLSVEGDGTSPRLSFGSQRLIKQRRYIRPCEVA